ncbi:SsrA-binding protein [Thermodesulfobium acidiphilum]|uniref:SsrA-binding protein n=1 Tax=Thermodesulfobium acidiphilum TaxID=1794699 RepID=A0A2R4W2M2_THEAF|nr:SsrA-binding protein SmpB [Thermodesulfobium acidiphilum]AWB11069.1 SsrA-binding protein [Thermodesulfobium acidiphilum]PMP86384.1 MAG: SsrA-binding protein [Thermodesulfobium narugense]
MSSFSPIIENRKARFEYEILETLETGIELKGTEVKSLRLGKASFSGSYCQVEKGELWIYDFHISPYEQGNIFNLDPKRKRKLLAHRGEIFRLYNAVKRKGLTLIPLKLYWKRGMAKVQVGLARGKKLYDKRESIKKRTMEKESRRGDY